MTMTRRKKYQATTAEVFCSSCSSFLVRRLKDEALVLVFKLYTCIAFTSGHCEGMLALVQ
jgi:hypothetical protein